jgi:hypothetical protein
MTVSVYYELDGGTYDDYNLKVGMGDAGTISFSGVVIKIIVHGFWVKVPI